MSKSFQVIQDSNLHNTNETYNLQLSYVKDYKYLGFEFDRS